VANGLRIVILDTSNPDEMTGGQSVFIRNLLPRLDGEIRVVGATGGPEALGTWQSRSLHGVSYEFMAVARMGAPGRAPRVPLRLASLIGVARFRRAILRAGDVMYVQSPDMGLPLTFGAARKPMVFHVHGAANPLVASRYNWARNPILRRAYARLQRRIINASRLVFSVDEAGLRLCRENLTRGSTTRLELVPICVDTTLFCVGDRGAARASHGLAASDKVVIFVGRLEQAKGVEQLVDSLELLAKHSPPIRLVVIGDGSQRDAMEERARRSGVLDRIVFAGWVAHDQLPSWLRASDALVLPSAHEGLPTVVIEALACGVPVVATPVGDVPRLVHEGTNGLILNERTPQALAEALDRVLAAAWSMHDLAASVSDYSAERVASLTSGLLAQAASLPNPRPGRIRAEKGPLRARRRRR
jgi:glycosyltransferase involved in cell wall biosynthesis